MNKLLDQLVAEMVTRGVHYADAQREFEKRFIGCVIDTHDGNLCKAADTLGVHRNTLTRKVKDLKIRVRSL
ncbi:MAG: helix-turn-helix domain-containing protein [Acidobacteriota bacterium]|nr:helix-turn-helix domain-containing protein [Acidobacteriota bacterium]MDP2390112.1 helix-turn-helix domain-containing protein [Acidobacteriota bacterium]